MNVVQSTEFMDSMTNVKEDIVLNYGKSSYSALIASQ